LLRRPDGDEVMFTSITFFTGMDDVCAFAGEDPGQAVVEDPARPILTGGTNVLPTTTSRSTSGGDPPARSAGLDHGFRLVCLRIAREVDGLQLSNVERRASNVERRATAVVTMATGKVTTARGATGIETDGGRDSLALDHRR
jgi:hypothetical protein